MILILTILDRNQVFDKFWKSKKDDLVIVEEVWSPSEKTDRLIYGYYKYHPDLKLLQFFRQINHLVIGIYRKDNELTDDEFNDPNLISALSQVSGSLNNVKIEREDFIVRIKKRLSEINHEIQRKVNAWEESIKKFISANLKKYYYAF